MIEIQVGKRTFPVRFDLGAWMEIDERFGGLDQMEADKTVKARIACLAIFARAGARYCGGEAPTEEYLTKNLSPKALAQANRVCGGHEARNGGGRRRGYRRGGRKTQKKRSASLTARRCASYALIAGVNWPEAERMAPGLIMDLYLARRAYDDDQHGIRRTRTGEWED